MADNTPIEWTDATWNPVTGCSVVSPGCTNCYAMKLAGGRLQHVASRQGLTVASKAGPVWNGKVRFNAAELTRPLAWRRPRRIFVCAHGDLFHESVPAAWIDRVFAVMALSPQHTFQILTKRAERMREYVAERAPGRIIDAALRMKELPRNWQWPLPNVWLGVSAEDQARADERIPHLLATPAAVRFLSAEPLLGAIDLTRVGSLDIIRTVHPGMVGWIEQDLRPEPIGGMTMDALTGAYVYQTPNHMGGCAAQGQSPHIDWAIVGGESGPGARPMHPDWARQLRDQCAAAGVPFFFKQWGAWAPTKPPYNLTHETVTLLPDGRTRDDDGAGRLVHDRMRPMSRVGKKAAGRLLDGVEHNAMPGVAA